MHAGPPLRFSPRALVISVALTAAAPPLFAQQGGTAQPRQIVAGQEVRERLDTRDPVLPDDTRYDLWSYRGRAGERITVVMRSDDFDTFLAAGPRAGAPADFTETNDDGGESGDGTNSRLVLTLPRDGEYLIRAGSYEGGATGAYTLRLHATGAPASSPSSGASAPSGAPAPSGGGQLISGRQVRGTLSTSDPMLADGAHYDEWRYNGYARERVRIAMNAPGFDAYLAIGTGTGRSMEVLASDDDGGEGTNSLIEVMLPRSGEYVIRASSLHGGQTGEYTLVAQGLGIDHNVSAPSPPPSGASPSPSPSGERLVPGREVRGSLDGGDPRLADGRHYDVWRYTGAQGERITLAMNSSSFDAFLTLGTGPASGMSVLATDDDGGDGTNARIEIILPRSDEYTIRASSLTGGETGDYTLVLQGQGRVSGAPAPAQPARPQPAQQAAPPRPAQRYTPLQAFDQVRNEPTPGYTRVVYGSAVVDATDPYPVRVESQAGAEYMAIIFSAPVDPAPTLQLYALRGEERTPPTTPTTVDESARYPGTRAIAFSYRPPADVRGGDRIAFNISTAARAPRTLVYYVVWKRN